MNKPVICYCLNLEANLNIRVEFKYLFVPKRTDSSTSAPPGWIVPPFRTIRHPNVCLIISEIVSYIFYLLHSNTNVENIGYCAAGSECSMITSIDILKKVGESAKGASSWQDWKFYQGSTNENE